MVSVVLPVYNQANLIRESIESVLNQTYKRFELIVVNDGSSDEIHAALARYQGHPAVTVIDQTNQRLPRALSNGFALARGEYWTWTSADNAMEPRMLEVLVADLERNPEIGMVYGDYRVMDDRGNPLQDPSWRAHNRPQPDTAEIRLPRTTDSLNTVDDNFIGPCFMYRGWIGKVIGDYDPQMGIEDYDYWMRINALFVVRHVEGDDLLYKYRVHDNCLSANAAEHRISQKVHKLMAFEKHREVHYKVPLRLAAHATCRSLLSSLGVGDAEMIPVEEEGDAVVVPLSEYAKNPGMYNSRDALMVLCQDAEQFDYSRLWAIPANKVLVMVQDERTATQVSLVTRAPCVDATACDTIEALRAFIKSRQLSVPVACKEIEDLVYWTRPANRTVLLQADQFLQGGMENVVIDLALALTGEGFRPIIAIFGPEGDAAKKAHDLGIRVLSYGIVPEEETYARCLRENHIDLVNAHFSVIGAGICSQMGVPFVQTVHSSYVWLDPDTVNKFREADAFTSAYFCVSATAARYADTVLGLDVKKMRIVPNGVDPVIFDNKKCAMSRAKIRKRWRVANDCTVFLNIGSISAVKGQRILLNAFSEVCKISPNSKLVHLGAVLEPAYYDEFKSRIHELCLDSRVILEPYDREVAGYYQAADIFVLPSLLEGWSLALAEARANGLPCVLTDVGSAYELYGDSNVELVAPPYDDVAKLDYVRFNEVAYGIHPAFEARIADAMMRSIGKRRCIPDAEVLNRLSRTYAFGVYAREFFRLLKGTGATDVALPMRT